MRFRFEIWYIWNFLFVSQCHLHMIIERMAPSFISEIDHCTSTPCLNNGTCSSRNGTFDCTCSKGWTGRMCEQGINSIYTHQGHAYQTLYMYYTVVVTEWQEFFCVPFYRCWWVFGQSMLWQQHVCKCCRVLPLPLSSR